MDLSGLDRLQYQMPVRRFDSLSAFTAEQLLQIVPKIYERKFPGLDAERYIPIESNINPGAMSWAFPIMDQRGVAEFMSANGRDIPRADVSMDRAIFPIRTIVSSYGWTIEEMEAGRFAGVPLDSRKGMAAKRAIDEKQNSILLNGDVARGLPGFLTNPRVPIITVPNGNWLDAGTDADEIGADLNAMVDTMFAATKRIHGVNTILLPNAHYRKALSVRISNTAVTAMQFFKSNNPNVDVQPMNELETAGPSGGPRAVAYEKMPENLGGVVPMTFSQLDPQVAGFETVIPVRAREGGTVLYYEMAFEYVDGI